MSRLFGCICNQPERLVPALEPVREVLRAEGPISRWGLGYVQSGEVLLSRHPLPVGEHDFYEALGDLQSDYVIGFAADEDGYTGNANTQPYRFRHWFYAQSGETERAEELYEALGQHLPAFLGRNVKGKAPAELVFHLFLSMLHDAGQIDDPNLDPQITRQVLRDTLAFVSSTIEKVGGTGGPGNLVVSNSRSMLAIRLAKPLFLRRLKQQEDPKRPDTEFKAVLVVDGDELPGEGFEELPPRSVLAISRDVTTDISELDA